MHLEDLSLALTDETIAKLAQLRRDAGVVAVKVRDAGYKDWALAIPVMLDALEVSLYMARAGVIGYDNNHIDTLHAVFTDWDGVKR